MTESMYNYINLEYLDLMADGDTDMKQTMLAMLLEELPDEVSKIVEMSKVADMKGLKAVSHKMKSTLAFVGYPLMDKTNKDVERIAMGEGNVEELTTLATNLDTYCKQVLTELKSEFSKL